MNGRGLKLLVFFLVILVKTGNGQELQNTLGTVSISSPTAASLGKFGDIPVSYHTGVPNVDIPLYTVKAGPLSLPVSMSYHASGLKVMEPAGWVGAGWALNAGGVITRTVVGQPDENGTNSGAEIDGHYTQNGYNSYLYGAGVQDWQGFAAGRKDGEPDMYFFNFGGYSGKFYFRDDHTPILVPQQDLRIIPVFTGGRSFDYFTIITPDGTQYLFGNAPGVTGTAPVEYTNCYSAKNGAVGFPPVSSWYLSKVVSADNQFVINLSYQPESYGYFTISMFPVDGWKTGTDGQGYDLVKDLIQGVRLSQISFPNGTVSFVPGAVRTDLSDNAQSLTDAVNTSAVSLGAVQIADSSGHYCKQFKFSYDYFSGDNTALPNSLTWGATITTDQRKLKLNSIQEVSCDGSVQVPPYKFTYASGVVPRRLSFAVDHWGYYNGQTANTGLIPTYTVNGNAVNGANRDASWPEMLDGALTRIDYPTGGYDVMNFESNSAYVTVSVPGISYLAQFAFHVFGQSATSGSSTFTSNGNDITITYSTNCNFGGPLAIVNSSGQTVYNVVFSNTPNYNDNTPVTTSNTLPGSLFPPGSYTVTASLGAGPNDNITGGVSISLAQPDVSSETVLKTLGGIRIQSLTKSDGITSTVQQTNYTYSGGILYSQPTYAQMIRNDLIANVGYWNPSTGYGNALFPNGCPSTGGYYKSPGSIRPMASLDGSIMGYLTVSVAQPGNGRTDYYYATPSGGYGSFNNIQSFTTVAQTCSSSIPNYPSAPLPYDPYRGLLISENHFDESGKQLKAISYTTTFNQSPTLSTPGFMVTSVDFGSGSQLLGTFYTLNTARKVSVQTLEDDFAPSGSYVRKTTTTYFASPFHNQPTRTVASTSVGDSLATNSTYVADIRLTSCDAISDCSTEYNSACNSCLSSYNSARTSCAGSSTCLTTAYLNYQQCNTNARTSYVGCRASNTSALNSCHLNAEGSADNVLKSVLVLQDDNVNSPVEVSKWRNTSLMQSNFTSYSPATNPAGFPYPAKTQLVDLASLSTALTPAVVAGNAIVKDSRYQDEISYQFGAGNLQSTTSRSGIPTSYIWDYSNSEPVAKVVNSGPADIAYTSFESNASGNWVVSGGTIDAASAVTGRRSCSLGGGTISAQGLNSANTYFISYWMQASSHASLTVTGTLNGYPKIGKTVVINGAPWTLFVHKVAGQSSVTISGNARIDELRLYPVTAQMTTYTYDPLVGMTSQTDAGDRVTYYEYDGLSRLKRIRDQDYNILKTYEYQYQVQAGCGGGCAVVAMQTLAGSNTIGYPVGVFNVHGNLLGNAAGADQYVSLWNSDTADEAVGTLAKSSDSLHFNLTLNAGKTAPAGVTGCRYYQYDIPWTNIDAIRPNSGQYVDFGDGTGMKIPQTFAYSDTPTVMPPNTVRYGFFNQWSQLWYFVHSYPDSTLKTLTFYHSDGNETPDLDNIQNPANSLMRVRNFRGNLPQNASGLGGSCFQQSSATSVAGISNWNHIHSVRDFALWIGDGVNGCLNIGYAQDFMAGNPGLQSIVTTDSRYYRTGAQDATFRLTRLKTDWNTWFTQLQEIWVADDQWNREDLSALTHLMNFTLVATNQNHSNDTTGNPIVPIPPAVLDNVINQIAAGSGRANSNGLIYLLPGGTTRTSASDAAFNLLKSKGWSIYIEGVLQ